MFDDDGNDLPLHHIKCIQGDVAYSRGMGIRETKQLHSMIENQHPYIPCASDETIVWHYFSLSQFLWMIENKRLHFTRADRFEDKYEVFIPEWDVKCIWGENADSAKVKKFVWRLRKRTFINCWAMSDHELALMWKSYSSSKEGIAIKSSVKKIRECRSRKDDFELLSVRYINPRAKTVAPSSEKVENVYRFFVTKRNLFEQEKEIRIVYYSDKYMGKKPLKDFSIEIDLKTLIEEIHIAPNADQWFVDLVKSVCNRYGLEGIPVVKSEMI